MKKLILILSALLISTAAFSDDEMPAYMKDGVITVTLKSGKVYTFSLNEYKVVRRGSSKREESAAAPRSSKEMAAQAPRKNRVKLLGGSGPKSLSTTVHGGTATIKSENGAVGGVGYERMLDDKISVGGQVINNGTYLLDVGLDF